MIKAVVIDKSQNSCDSISFYIEKMEGVRVLYCYDDIMAFEYDKDIDLILFNINSQKADEILDKIQEFKKQNKNLITIALSYEINSELVVKTLNKGVDEFLLKPTIQNVLENAIKKAILKKEKRTKADIITVFSDKGGVGKTSLAVNLAYSLEDITKKNICILSFGYNLMDSMSLLNLESKQNINFILANIENSIKDFVLSLIPKYKDKNLYVLSVQNQDDFNFKISPEIINKIIVSLKPIFDYIIIDSNSLMDEKNLVVLNETDLILFITMQNQAVLKNLEKTVQMFDNIGINSGKIKLIASRYLENSQIQPEDIEKVFKKEIFAKIPNNYITLTDAINQGKTVLETNPQSDIAKAYSNLAFKITKIDFENMRSLSNYNYGIFNLLRRIGE